jgi:hypothetical protein
LRLRVGAWTPFVEVIVISFVEAFLN